MAFKVPTWFSVLDQELLDGAIEQATALLVGPSTLHDSGRALTEWDPYDDRVRDIVTRSHAYPSDAEAIRAALLVSENATAAVLRHCDEQPARELRRAADDLLDQIIVWVNQFRSYASDLNPFATAVHAALATCPWRVAFLDTLQALREPRPVPVRGLEASVSAREPEASISDSPRDEDEPSREPEASAPGSPLDEDDPLFGVPEAAERLSVSDDTIHRMIKQNKLAFVMVGKRKKIHLSELKRALKEDTWRYLDRNR